jgi:hypothetical protein
VCGTIPTHTPSLTGQASFHVPATQARISLLSAIATVDRPLPDRLGDLDMLVFAFFVAWLVACFGVLGMWVFRDLREAKPVSAETAKG